MKTLGDVEDTVLEIIESIDHALESISGRDTMPTVVVLNNLLDARVVAQRLLDIDLKNVVSASEGETDDETAVELRVRRPEL
jgi:hypothetical protein